MITINLSGAAADYIAGTGKVESPSDANERAFADWFQRAERRNFGRGYRLTLTVPAWVANWIADDLELIAYGQGLDSSAGERRGARKFITDLVDSGQRKANDGPTRQELEAGGYLAEDVASMTESALVDEFFDMPHLSEIESTEAWAAGHVSRRMRNSVNDQGCHGLRCSACGATTEEDGQEVSHKDDCRAGQALITAAAQRKRLEAVSAEIDRRQEPRHTVVMEVVHVKDSQGLRPVTRVRVHANTQSDPIYRFELPGALNVFGPDMARHLAAHGWVRTGDLDFIAGPNEYRAPVQAAPDPELTPNQRKALAMAASLETQGSRLSDGLGISLHTARALDSMGLGELSEGMDKPWRAGYRKAAQARRVWSLELTERGKALASR